jgi:hypothetical protein
MKFSEIILENRIDDFKNIYSRKYSPEQLKKIIDLIPQKFLIWFGKNFDSVNFNENFPSIQDALNTFVRVGSNLPKTDLNEYQNISELIDAIKDYQNKSRREIRKVEGGNVVYEDPRFFVVNPLTHDSSCYYGKGTKWCTAADTDYQFNQYNKDGKLFYILDKTKSTNDPHYKVAILQKFDGDNTVYDAKDEVINNITEIFGQENYDKIKSSIGNYLEEQFGEQLKVWRDKQEAKKNREVSERLRKQRILDQRTEEAEERRLESEWALGPDCPEEGLKAHALLKYLEDNEGVTVLDNDDRADVERIKTEIEELQTRYDNDDEVRTDLLDEIEELEEQLQEYENWIDVYNIVPTGEYYETTEFEVINSDLDEKRFAVGTEDEMQTSAYESIENLIDDIGYEGFNSSFARGYIDTDSVVSYAEDVYDEDVRNNPDVYFDNDERMLSEEQEESIGILKMRISQTQRVISNLEEQFGEDEDDDIQEKIEELEDLIVEYDDEIQEIEDSPDGDFPDDLVDEKVNELVMDVRRDPESFMENFGLEWSEYVDKEEFIQGVIDTDGLAHVLNTYDGSADEIYVQQQLFYVMRID